MSSGPSLRRFEILRQRRDREGRSERGRGDGDPFQGDPIAELIAECADGVNYAEEAQAQGRLELWQYRAIDYHLRQAAWLAMASEDAGSEDA